MGLQRRLSHYSLKSSRSYKTALCQHSHFPFLHDSIHSLQSDHRYQSPTSQPRSLKLQTPDTPTTSTMKFAVLATVLAAATTVSSAAPSHEFSPRSPGYSVKWRPGCQIWQFMICGLKARRDTETPGGASAAAEYYSNIVKTVQHSKNLYN